MFKNFGELIWIFLANALFGSCACPNCSSFVADVGGESANHICSDSLLPGAKSQIFEDGFHSSILVNKNGREALGLIKLLKLEDEVIGANIEASARRHLLHRGSVRLVPGPHHVLLYGPALMVEPLWPRSRDADESVYDFVARRASKTLAKNLADPICRGQLAGDAKELSVRTCFPRLWHNERRFGSVFLGVRCFGCVEITSLENVHLQCACIIVFVHTLFHILFHT